jgi:hypothetical protein
VNRKSRPTILAKILRDIVSNALRGNKDEDFRIFGTYLIEMLLQFVLPLEITAYSDNLLL